MIPARAYHIKTGRDVDMLLFDRVKEEDSERDLATQV